MAMATTTTSPAIHWWQEPKWLYWTIGVLFALCVGLGVYYNWPSSAPPVATEPIQTVDQKIWAGYYKAEVHVRYYDRMADFYDSLDRWSTIILAVVAVAIIIAASYTANSRLSKATKTRLFVFEGVVTVISVAFALWNFGALADTHRQAANAWRDLAYEWDQARSKREFEPQDELRKLQAELAAREKQIEDEIEPTGYIRWYFRKTQRDYNRYLGISS